MSNYENNGVTIYMKKTSVRHSKKDDSGQIGEKLYSFGDREITTHGVIIIEAFYTCASPHTPPLSYTLLSLYNRSLTHSLHEESIKLPKSKFRQFSPRKWFDNHSKSKVLQYFVTYIQQTISSQEWKWLEIIYQILS